MSRDGATGRWGGDHGGGRHITPRPYTKSSLNQDFAAVRELAFGKNEKRHLQDMRRSGAVEGDAGGGSVEDQSNKMANTVDRNKRLRQTCNPVNVASARRFDEARAKGARKLERTETKSIPSTPLGILLQSNSQAVGYAVRASMMLLGAAARVWRILHPCFLAVETTDLRRAKI